MKSHIQRKGSTMDSWNEFLKMVDDVWERKPLRFLIIIIGLILIALFVLIFWVLRAITMFAIDNILYIGGGIVLAFVLWVIYSRWGSASTKPRVPRPPTYGGAGASRSFPGQKPTLPQKKGGGWFSWLRRNKKSKTTFPPRPPQDGTRR